MRTGRLKWWWYGFRSQFRFEKSVDIPHLRVSCACPWLGVHALWYFCPNEYKAWPGQYETGIAVVWRLPWRKKLHHKEWMKYHPMPPAVYSAMDLVYLGRATPGMDPNDQMFVGQTVKKLVAQGSLCGHTYFIASCPGCARKALYFATHQTREIKALTQQVKELGGKPVSFEAKKLEGGNANTN